MRARFWIFPLLVCLAAACPAAENAPAAPSAATAIATPPLPQDMVQQFRELLKLTRPEREKALANRSPERRRDLMAKLREYEVMPPAERELKLRLVQLRMHLMPLMRLPPSERGGHLSLVPAEDRPLIEERLREWDKIPVDLQKEFLEHEGTIHYVLRMESSTPQQREQFLRSFPAERRQRLEQELVRWHGLPAESRSRMYSHFYDFFELDRKERDKTLRVLSEEERAQMEASLRAFDQLPAALRRHCLNSFHKFASMSAEERAQFLQNAARWEAMSAEERRTWRELVHALPPSPPLPPALMRVPPLPPGLTIATNDAP
jgi:hypothetical protein